MTYRSVPADVAVPIARDRRNVSSVARAPNTADASVQSAVASTCGHSSSQRSAVGSDRTRRSCVTIASCHATSRALSDAASAVSVPRAAIAYGFIFKSPRAAYTCRVLVFEPALKLERSVVAGRCPTCSGGRCKYTRQTGPITNGRRGGRCRCREALARMPAKGEKSIADRPSL